MIPSYELTRLDSNNFEHLVNALAMQVLGYGVTGFGPGADGGRDGFFEGNAPYPSLTNQWSGVWYIQSKFHAPHLSSDPQSWLLSQIKKEISQFNSRNSRRTRPNNWIVATNIDPSGVPQTGGFDAAKSVVKEWDAEIGERFHIWGGQKILSMLASCPAVAEYYSEFLTPGNVLQALYNGINDQFAQVKDVVRYLSVTQMSEQQYTRLEQAGSNVDNRPGVQRLFTDLPFKSQSSDAVYMAADALAATIAQIHRPVAHGAVDKLWKQWSSRPRRARAWFIKGGPGQGKSTLTQYVAQIQRAALVISNDMNVIPAQRAVAEEIKKISLAQNFWPEKPRIPILIELKDYAFWYGGRRKNQPRKMITYIAEKLSEDMGISVLPGTLTRMFASARWLFIFDGLDEVPGDVKDSAAAEVIYFSNDFLLGCNCDSVVVCTSRPQGYSGQFSSLEAATVDLLPLSAAQALACARPLLEIDRSPADSKAFVKTLSEALKSQAVAEIMTTPLQAHIMAVIVRDGGRPPERKWNLFNTFYEIIKKREANRNLPDKALAKLLREEDLLLRALHNRLGFELHFRAETSKGASTSINRKELKIIVTEVVSKLQDYNIKSTISVLMKATTERLVLVSTPENGEQVRFDIRPLQEFFAAEHIYRANISNQLDMKLKLIAADSHWREVMHFLLSALIENGRTSDIAIANSILLNLDSGDLSSVRMFNRRMARGCITACRLLSEGVLEQDKRIRSGFRPVISSIASQITLGSINIDKRLQRQSRAWIKEVLFSTIKENSVEDTIGACAGLALIADERDKRNVDLYKFVDNTSIDYQSCLIYMLSSLPPDYILPKWVIEISLKFLCAENWLSSREEGLFGALTILYRHAQLISPCAVHLGWDSEVAKLLPIFLKEKFEIVQGNQSYLFGIVAVELYSCHPRSTFDELSLSKLRNISKLGGWFHASCAAIEFVKYKSEASFLKLNKALGGDITKIRLLSTISSLWYDEDVYLNKSDDITPDALLEKSYPGLLRLFSCRPARGNDIDWSEFIKRKPALFASYISDIRGDEVFSEKFNDGSYDDLIVERLISTGVMLGCVSSWGKLFDKRFSFSEELRNKTMMTIPQYQKTQSFGATLFTFKLSLPNEAEALAYIIRHVIESIDSPSVGLSNENAPKKNMKNIFEDTLREYVDNLDSVREIWHDLSRGISTRSAAFIFDMACSSKRNRPNFDDVLGIYNDEFAEWFIPGIGYAIFDEIARGDERAISMFGSLLERASSNYFARIAIDRVFQAWREIPGAPVSMSRASVDW